MVLLIGVIAIVSPPNNGDGMSYHMPRVVHWIQNRTVAFYPTHILRQLYLAPGAEYAIAHFQVLSGGDRFANLVQWLSMVGCLVGVSLIAKELGGDENVQVAGTVICATIPMGILQGSSVQTDYAVSLWLVCMAFFTLRLLRRPDRADRWLLAASLALALLTKATAYLFAAPFLVWVVVDGMRKGRRVGMAIIGTLTVVVAILNGAFVFRNIELFGSPLGPSVHGDSSGSQKISNETLDPRASISNFTRNLALHIGTPSKRVNAVEDRTVRYIHAIIHFDADDPRTTWGRFRIVPLSNSEDGAGNPAHLLLLMLAAGWCLTGSSARVGLLRRYLLAAAAGFGLFCIFLKWQPWNSRLQLPLFVLVAPFVGRAIADRGKKVKDAVLIGLLLLALPWLFLNSMKPLVVVQGVPCLNNRQSIFRRTREEMYLSARADLAPEFVAAARVAEELGVTKVGLWLESLEYPFWVYLQKGGVTQIRHVCVRNRSRDENGREGDGDSRELARIVFDPSGAAPEMSNEFERVMRNGGVSVLKRRSR
jgi:4-amino-4-deoxy-L-arabinose transferase-like glycosyltransferase